MNGSRDSGPTSRPKLFTSDEWGDWPQRSPAKNNADGIVAWLFIIICLIAAVGFSIHKLESQQKQPSLRGAPLQSVSHP